MKSGKNLMIFLVALVMLLPAVGGTVATQGDRPLLMPGKKSLYQRVLAQPGAILYSKPLASGSQQARAIVPFTVFYVYDRVSVDRRDWVKVGINKFRGAQGWVPADNLIAWKQTLTLAFKDPTGHDRVLLFRDRDSLKSLATSGDLFGYNLLYEKASRGELSEDSPVVSIQPKAYVDLLEDFYLVPILDHEDIFIRNEPGNLLKVTTLTLQEDYESPRARSAAPPPTDYRSAIVFVIDSTVSMGPYIDRTREAVRKVYRKIEARGLQDKVSFGLVAYRDNVPAAPGLGYLTKIYADLQSGTDPGEFFARVNQLRPARVSSKDFQEDAYAGVKRAIEEIDWSGYAARYIVLITDAGARTAQDPLGSTGLDAKGLQQLAYDKGISIWALHLKTPEGAANHAQAAAQYRELSYYPGIGELYYPVELGRVGAFGEALDLFAGRITDQVASATTGKEPAPVRNVEGDTEIEELKRKVDVLGYALRMRYLQKRAGGKVPEVFDAWLVDRDLADPARKSVEVRVLLTRDQLSDLQAVLKKVLETAENGVFSPRDFLDELKSVAATISRDPTSAATATRTAGASGKNLADLGYMREYIDDLPYKGEIMNVSLEDWEDWPASRQLKFMHRLEAKINYYQTIHDNTDLWISLDGGPVTGESVYPVSLSMLP